MKLSMILGFVSALAIGHSVGIWQARRSQHLAVERFLQTDEFTQMFRSAVDKNGLGDCLP